MDNSSQLPSRILLALCFLMAAAGPASANFFYVDSGNGGTYNMHSRSFLERRYYHVYHQRFDFSCGSAALASLLTFHYRRPTDERIIIRAMYEAGDQEKIRREGFSLLDMKNYLQSIGLRANGYHESLDKLARVGIPAIVLINRKGYLHFVVVQGVTRDKVLYGDPALGKKIMDRKQFEAMWTNGILFVVEDEMSFARRTFNTNWAWNVKKPENFVMPLPNTDLASFTLLTSYAPNSFK
jgi:predicted double-glycine peptidase